MSTFKRVYYTHASTRLWRSIIFLIVGTGVILFPLASHAHSIADHHYSLWETIVRSSLIITGSVKDTVQLGDATYSTVTIDEILHGHEKSKTIMILARSARYINDDFPFILEIGRQYVLFLRDTDLPGIYQAANLVSGHMRIENRNVPSHVLIPPMFRFIDKLNDTLPLDALQSRIQATPKDELKKYEWGSSRLRSIEHFRDQELNGQAEYYSDSGGVLFMCHYSVGKKDGQARRYDAEGRLTHAYTYTNDELKSESIFDTQTDDLRASIHYDQGRIIYRALWDSGPEPILEKYYKTSGIFHSPRDADAGRVHPNYTPEWYRPAYRNIIKNMEIRRLSIDDYFATVIREPDTRFIRVEIRHRDTFLEFNPNATENPHNLNHTIRYDLESDTILSIDYWNGEAPKSAPREPLTSSQIPARRSEIVSPTTKKAGKKNSKFNIDLHVDPDTIIAGEKFEFYIAVRTDFDESYTVMIDHQGSNVADKRVAALDTYYQSKFFLTETYPGEKTYRVWIAQGEKQDRILTPVLQHTFTVMGEATGEDPDKERTERFAWKKSRDAMVGASAPVIQGVSLKGETITLESYAGQVVLLDFWATWCGPCVRELPNVKSTYQQYRDRGFTVIGLSLDGDSNVVSKFTADQTVDWPQIILNGGWDHAAVKRYFVNSIPATYLIGKNGKILAFGLRGDALSAQVKKAVESP